MATQVKNGMSKKGEKWKVQQIYVMWERRYRIPSQQNKYSGLF